MDCDSRTRRELENELEELHRRIAELEAAEFKRKSAEEALRQSEEQFRNAFEYAATGMALIALDGKFIKVNHVLCEILGYTEEELLSMSCKSITYPDDQPKDSDYSNRLLRGDFPFYHFEKRYIHKKGHIIWSLLSVSLVRNTGGEPIHFISQLQDITHRRKIEEELREGRNIARAFIDAPQDAVILVDTGGTVFDLNDTMAKRFGKTVDDFIGLRAFDLLPDGVAGGRREQFEKVISTGKPSRIIDERNGRQYDNTIYPVSDAHGKITRLAVVSRDITEQIAAEKELLESKERYRRLVEFFPDAIFVHHDVKILYANNAAVKLTGCHHVLELIGKSGYKFVHSDYHKMAWERSQQAQNELKSVSPQEMKIVKSDGSTIDVEVTSTNIQYEDRQAVLSVVRDITEQKRAVELGRKIVEKDSQLNEALEYDKLKTEFFSNISHEFKTPITLILSTLQMANLYLGGLIPADKTKKTDKYFNIMKQNCYRLLRLVNNLIDITRIDAGYFEVELQNHNIIDIIENVTLSVAEFIENKGISLLFDTELEEKIIACDPDKIERIMLNLLSNAVKFTKQGGSISVYIYEKNNHMIISVKDNGIGIPQDKLNIIFDRFRQVDRSLTRNHEGSGIGLSIVKSLVNMHGGTLRVESEYGKGSNFIIELPANLVQTEVSTYGGSLQPPQVERTNMEFSDIYL